MTILKKAVISLLILTPLLSAKVYTANIEPVETFYIYAQTSGEIIKLDDKRENTVVNGEVMLIDNKIEKARMKTYKRQLKMYKEQEVIRKRLYESSKNIAGKSQSQKDTLHLNLLDLQVRIEDMKLSISELQDTLDKKSVKVKNLYVKEFYVNESDYVNVGAKMVELYDISKGRLTIYIHKNEIKDIKKKTIYINGVANRAEISKLDKTLDAVYVSSYKAELITDDVSFGKLVKVEFKDAPKASLKSLH
jgi:hypothetical protein